MKVYNKVVINMNTSEILYEDSYEYNGMVALCLGGGGGGDTTVTQTNTPWAGAEPGLTEIYNKFQEQYMPNTWERMNAQGQISGNPWDIFYYPYDRVADMNPTQQDALNWTKQYASDWESTMGAPAALLNSTLKGEYLTPESNPYLGQYAEAATDPMIQNYLNNIVPTMDNQAVASGRYGSGAWGDMRAQAAEDLDKQIGYTNASIFAPAYQQERQLQQDATGAWLDLVNQGYKNIGYLSAAGEAEQAQSQNELDAEMSKWMDQLYGPMDWANIVANMFLSGGALGRTTEQTSPYTGPSMAQSLLGTGTSLAGLGKMLGLF